jgi:polyisoprenoid-binding protein YceI
MTFTSHRIEVHNQAVGHYRVRGTLTIRGGARAVMLDAWNSPPQPASEGRLTCTLTARLDRRDWGLTWKLRSSRL